VIARLGSGWQTITADLALILFLVTAQATVSEPALSGDLPPPQESEPAPTPTPTPHAVEGSGMAVFRPGPGLDLKKWLAETRTDDRQSVTAIVRFPADGRGAAMGRAERLMAALEEAGARPRLVIEPAQEAETLVVIGYEGAS
jgi:hypothetical protein